MRKLLDVRIPLIGLLLLAGARVAAEDGYYVVVASFQSAERAEQGVGNIGAQFIDPLTVMRAETSVGPRFRIVAGPYADRDTANTSLGQARADGFADAWLVGSAGLSPADPYDIDALLNGVDEELSLPGPIPDASPEGSAVEREERELVEEPPPGYRLHKLRRDAQARPPPGQEAVPAEIDIDLNTGQPLRLSRLTHSESNITIDGKLSEAVWAGVTPITDFHAVEPDTLAPAHLRTELRLIYTEKGLYAAFDMDQDHDTFVRWIIGRDKGFQSGDHVGITLDTSGEGLYGYWMSISLGDVQSDGTLLPPRRFSRDWDGAWYGRAAETERGWSAEMFIPWSQVTMPRQQGTRRMGVYASRKYSAEDVRWGVPSLPPTRTVFISAMRPMLMDGVDPQQQWSIFPYASVTQNEVEDGLSTKVGADLFWRPSSNFQLTAALNPDFGNVESDDVIVNLSAFEAFFPERRLFFLEGREIFQTTPRSDPFRNRDPVSVVNTRRIGGAPRPPQNVPDGVDIPRRELGQPTELFGAVKTTGQIGRVRYGLLGASEDEVKFDAGALNLRQDGSDYGVARFLYETSVGGDYRALGTISTLVAHPEEDAMVHGVDAHWRSPTGRWIVDSQLLYSSIDGGGEGYGGLTDIVYAPRRGLRVTLGLSHYDERLDINDLGFLRRNDATNARLRGEYVNSSISWARELAIRPFVQWEWNGDGRATRKGLGSNFDVLLPNNAQIETSFAYFPERYEDRESFGNGTYQIDGRHDTFVSYESDDAKRFSYYAGFAHKGEQKGGNAIEAALGFVWRPLDRMTLDVTAEWRRRDGWLLHQEDRNFTTFETYEWRPKASLEYNFTARQQLRLLAQWVSIKANELDFFLIPERTGALISTAKPDAASDDFNISNLNVQLRYRWEMAPLSDLFIVYSLNGFQTPNPATFDDLFNEAWENPDIEQLVVKLRYRLGS